MSPETLRELYRITILLGIAFLVIREVGRAIKRYRGITKKGKCPGCSGPLEVDKFLGKEVKCLDDLTYCKECLRVGKCGCKLV